MVTAFAFSPTSVVLGAVIVGAALASIAIPAILSAAGFGATGVAGASFASLWQPTFPLVPKGSLFSLLQSGSDARMWHGVSQHRCWIVGSVFAGWQ
jgi:hypothetical protein